MPMPDSTTMRLPELSKAIDRGLVNPVATSAIWYPEATLGLTDLEGVSVAEQGLSAAETIHVKNKVWNVSKGTRVLQLSESITEGRMIG